MTEPKLSIVDLTKRYAAGLEPAVDRLNMEVEEGHLVALLGPSGCGKTTTLRMVAGLMDPTAGSIVVDGKEITHTPVNKRGMGMVFQSYALFPHMNVEQNVAFGLEMRQTPKSEQKARVAAALDMVQLGHLGKRQTKELSGGQQQRIALARALVVEPTLLLLDEPLSNLDAKLRETMRTEIRSIQQRTRATTLFVTHDQDEALDMADRIAVMNGGLIEQFGSPTDVYERPRTHFVANFIGQANFLTARVGAETGGASLAGESYYKVDVEGLGQFGAVGAAGLSGSTHEMVIRPHRLTVALRPGADQTPVAGTIERVSYTGDALAVAVRVGDQQLQAQLLTSSGDLPRTGDAAYLSWAPEDAYLLPATTSAERLAA
ncbi:spermidine/putrescine ABC transporter ATP-binding protein [Arthrobacter sp. SPG23]|uniref:ABC transporter ATP-binding protein n=1 Tax=Arthrobacter sp. SPG23 TaxID=1610703 RepID=UPI0005C2ABE2|nr:ABC transporter ATP-binding protein [Arthrobacter sp. SPG23]KIS25954.1 spermidine/putrescine ABC transporter ATP-binding protein [Arthrobacter sp. SPG23]